jgi:hypothetical protein
VNAQVDPKCGYNLPHYRHILRKARAAGYWLPKVQDVAFGLPDRDFFLIRHDIDVSPWEALEMARLESEEGVETTYYFRLHAPYYNLLDARAADTVGQIAALGHEVGLHYEPGFFLARGEDPVDGTRRDIRIFEQLCGFTTRTIAQHQPAEGPLLGEISPDHPCAYQAALVREIPYFGDSGFHWREGCICTKLDRAARPQLHTLIHPHSWTVSDRGWQDVLRRHAGDLSARLAQEMEDYIASVEEYLVNRAAIDRARAAKYSSE